MPVTVCRPGWAKNPATMARKVANVGAVKQGRNTMSRSASERGRLGVSIGGCSFSGEWAADARLLGCTRQAGQLSRPSPPKSRNTSLDTAITILTDVVASTPGDDPRLSGRQSSLGLAISERFKRDGRPEDLQRAIGLLELALAATPGDHPHRAPALSNLATVLADRSDHDGLRRDRDRAVGLWQEATGVLSAPSHTRLTAAEAWAEMLAGEGQWDRALKGYNVAVELLDTTVWNAADRIGRERQIAYWAYLGGDSAACAVAAGRP